MNTLKKLIATAAFLFIMIGLSAQAPPHPNDGDAPSGAENQVGGGAPIGSGTLLLIGLGAAYGGRKIYNLRKEKDLKA